MNPLIFVKIKKPDDAEPRYFQARSREEYDALKETAVKNGFEFEHLFTSIEDIFVAFN